MFTAARSLWAIALIAGTATAAPAQTKPADAAPSSTQDALGYHSTFDGYQRFADQQVGPWREANDTVGRIGGWRAYAREAREPAQRSPAPSSAGTQTPAPVADPHAGHGHQ